MLAKLHYDHICFLIILSLGFLSCSHEKTVEEAFKFPEEQIIIKQPDSSEIFISELWENDSFNDEKEKQNYKLYQLLRKYLNEVDSVEQNKLQAVISAYQLDDALIKKSLQGDFYKFLGDHENDVAKKENFWKSALDFYEGSYGSMHKKYLDLLLEYGLLLFIELNELDKATPIMNRNIALREKLDEPNIDLIKSYRETAYLEYYKSEYLSALCNIKLAIQLAKKDSLINVELLSDCLNDEALYLSQLDEPELIIYPFEEFKSLDTSAIGLNARIVSHNNYATFFINGNEYEKARGELLIARRLLFHNSDEYLLVWSNYFELLFLEGRYDEIVTEIPKVLKESDRNDNFLSLVYMILGKSYEKLNLVYLAKKYLETAFEMKFGSILDSNVLDKDKLQLAYDNGEFDYFTDLLRVSAKSIALSNDTNKLKKYLLLYDSLDSLFENNLDVVDEESQLHLIDHYSSVFSDVLNGYYQLHKLNSTNESKIMHYVRQSKAVLLRKSKSSHMNQVNILGQSKNNRIINSIINREWKEIRTDYKEYSNYHFLLKCLKYKCKYTVKSEPDKSVDFLDEIKIVDIKEELKKQNSILISYVYYNQTMFGISHDGNELMFKKWYLDSLDLQDINDLKRTIAQEQLKQQNKSRVLRVSGKPNLSDLY